MSFRTGLEVLLDRPPPRWRQARLGLLLHQASVDAGLRLAHQAIDTAYPGRLRALFTPQHGLFGEQQDNMKETAHGTDAELHLPAYSLYSETRRPTPEMLRDLDVLLVDLQDVGCRVYTYAWTLLLCLQECARQGVEVAVLDRPNPIGGVQVEGPLLQPAFTSFVGGAPCPMRHGLTLGEMARWLCAVHRLDVALEVVPMAGWSRAQRFQDLGRTWIPPSPNLARLEGVDVYCGQVLWEASNVSEARGTTTPFELCGAPFVDAGAWWREARASTELPGVTARPVRFTPMFGKWSQRSCAGLALHVTDPVQFRPLRTTIALLRAATLLWPESLRLNDPPYEYETERTPLDLIHGSDRLRLALLHPESADPALLAEVDAGAWWTHVASALLYS